MSHPEAARAERSLDPDKLRAMREAATEAFLLYGFKRTSMADIADRAGMSRAALYLHFKNKRDVFRSVVQGLYEDGATRFEAALDPDGPVAETLEAAFVAKDNRIIERLAASGHGAEFLGMGQEAAQDIAQAGEARMTAILTRYVEATAAHRGKPTAAAPDEVADFVMRAYWLLKTSDAPEALRTRRIHLLARAAAGLVAP